MTGSVAFGAGEISTLTLGGEGPAGRGGAASRRRNLALALAMAVGAGLSGAVLGLVKQTQPGRTGDQLAYAAAAAVETAREAQANSKEAQKELVAAKAAIGTLKAELASLEESGVVQDAKDFQEAERLGLARFMNDSDALFGDDRRRVEIAIVREARKNGLDPLLVAAVIHVESRFNPFAVSGVGACGLMQLMPPTAQWLLEKNGVEAKIRTAHLFNPVLNIKLGTAYLAQLMNRFDGDLSLALIAYNAGPGTAHSLTPHSKAFKRLSSYPQSVLAAYRTLLLPQERLAAR
jgi:soluble lytic murein transglycosylase